MKQEFTPQDTIPLDFVKTMATWTQFPEWRENRQCKGWLQRGKHIAWKGDKYVYEATKK